MQPSLSAGLVLQNRYRLLNILGQGGFGRTYLAEDLGRFNERCALKEFIPVQSGNYALEKSKELFQREAATLYQIQHPQIPQFRATFEENQRLFLVQDYVEGKTYRAILNDRIAQGLAFTEAEAMQLLRQLLPVLAHIHAKGIIHRDIAPDNIMLRQSDFLPVLIDFGVVKEIATRLQTTATAPQSTTVGKLGYAPSEQMQTGRAYPSSDLYALAVTTVVLLTGREPQDLYDDMNLTWHWQRYANVHPGFVQVLNKMLSYRPGDRYQSVAEVAQALQALTHPAAMPPALPQSFGQQPSPMGQPDMYAATQPPTPNSTPFSEVQTVAIGRRPITTTTAGGGGAGRTRHADPSIPLPNQQSSSLWDNPLAVIGMGIGLAVVAGIASWAVVSAFLNVNNAPTPSPTVTVAPTLAPSPTPTESPSPSPSPTPTPSPDQPVEFDQRLNVNPGSTTSTQGSLRGNQTINYLVAIEEGQRLSATVEGDGVTMNVLAPDRQPADQQSSQVLRWDGRADFTGDYIVQVKPVDGANRTDYTLNLSLEGRPSPSPSPQPSPDPTPPDPEPGEVNVQTNYVDFSPGQEDQEVSAQVGANLIQRYLVSLQPNQTLNVQVVQGNVRLRLRDPDGRAIDGASGQSAQIGPGLPQAGDYQIDVRANQTVNFVIRVSLTN